MPKIDLDAAPTVAGTRYPAPFAAECDQRFKHKLGDAVGLSQFGVNLLRLPAGQWTAQRHWHVAEDEFVYVLSGEVVLVEDAGETRLGPGDCAGFKAGEADGHHIQNRSDQDALLLEVGSRRTGEDIVHYPDVDLHLDLERRFCRKDGTPYG